MNCESCNQETHTQEMLCRSCIHRQTLQEEEEIRQLNEEIELLEKQLQCAKEQVIKMESEKKLNTNDTISLNLENEIKELEKQEAEQETQLKDLKVKILDLEKNEDNLWEQINKFTRKLYQLFENNQIADNQLQQLNTELDRLSKMDIVNDLFKISVIDDVTCLNQLPLGKRGDSNIDWDELNAAVGHLALLLVYLFKKFQYIMVKIEFIECNGSFSRVVTKDKSSLNLFCQNKSPSVKEEEEFNDAFIYIYLEFGQFCKYLQEGEILGKRKIQLNLPYKMNGQMIGESSINLRNYSSAKWTAWTEGVKKFLANVKAVIVMNAQFDLSL